MFKLDLSEDYPYPVKVEVQGANGKTRTDTFVARFKRLPQSEIDDIVKRSAAGEILDSDVAAQVLVGWDGVCDSNGDEIVFSDSARDRILDFFPVRPAVISAWFASLQGAKAKN